MDTAKPYTTQDLVTALAGGSQQAFTQLFDTHYPLLFQQAFRLLKIRQSAEDVCNDVFANQWQNRQTLTRVQCLEAYLLTAVRNRSLTALKQMARSQTSLKDLSRQFSGKSLVADEHLLTREYVSFLQRQVDGLPARAKEVFGLCREEGLSYAEVSSKLGISRNAVKGHMVASVKKLKAVAEKGLDVSFVLVAAHLLLA